MNIRQMLAIARYEILLGLRRRSLIILLLLYIVGVIIFALIARDSNYAMRSRNVNNVPPGVTMSAEMWQGSWMVSIALMGTVILVCITITMLMNEMIPLDRQYKVRELLDTLPLSRATYLGGKLLGAWGIILLITMIAVIVSLGVFLAAFGSFDLRFWLAMWIAFAIPVTLISATTTVLLTSWAASRRIALLSSLLIIPLILIVFSIALSSLGVIGVFFEPSYGIFALLPPDVDVVAIISQRIRDAIPMLIAVPLVSWIVAWSWERFSEAR